jgi:hypothetical protein
MTVSTPAAAPSTGAAATPSRIRYAWLFSRRADLGMVLLPTLVTAFAFAWATRLGQDSHGSARTYVGWLTVYVLGDTSHVLLTFLLLGVRRDMLHATDRQARNVTLTSLAVFVASLSLMRLTENNQWTRPLFEVVTVVFATHHRLSQTKGFWSLYGLRGAQAGLPAPSARERSLQGLWVPFALLLIAIRWTLVARVPLDGVGPYQNVNPGDPAILPFAVTYGLVAAWLVFVAVLFRTLLSYDALNAPKLLYLATQCGVVAVELVAPAWGVVLQGGIHGIEYYLLTRKMLAPLPTETRSRLTAALCWPAMIAAMSPILLVGLLTNPIKSLSTGMGSWVVMLVNACVLAHYAADAFIYRFRIPGVRKVALARLGFGAPAA